MEGGSFGFFLKKQIEKISQRGGGVNP